jgi:hypothetical protein
MKPRALPSSDREAILRRAIIRAIPDYYSWPEIERERYRRRIPLRHARLFGETQGLEAHIRFIFSDKSALDAVRFRQFFSDYQRIAGDITELAVVIAQEKQAAVEFLQAQYRDIKKNFDPSVVPLRKKRKIVLADGALDDLS